MNRSELPEGDRDQMVRHALLMLPHQRFGPLWVQWTRTLYQLPPDWRSAVLGRLQNWELECVSLAEGEIFCERRI